MIGNREVVQPAFESFGDIDLVIPNIKTEGDVHINIKDNFSNIEIVDWLTSTVVLNTITISKDLLSQLKKAQYVITIYSSTYREKVLLDVK